MSDDGEKQTVEFTVRNFTEHLVDPMPDTHRVRRIEVPNPAIKSGFELGGVAGVREQ